MKNIIIGTAGHVDHGKSALIRRLTGVETDRLAEEKKRGITIDLGFAYLDLPDGGKAGIIDVPGHERFVSNMLAGAAGMDLVLLIVAADEGVMPQTREHLEILSLLGIPRGILVINKIDLVDEEWRMLVKEDLRHACRDSFLKDAPIAEVSAETGAGIDELKALIFSEIDQAQSKEANCPFRLPIDRAFTKGGFGLVVTGTALEGVLKKGEEITLYPEGENLKVRSIQVHGEDRAEGAAGQRLAINLTGEERSLVERGKWLAQKDSLLPSEYLEIELSLLPSADFTVKNESRLHVHHGAGESLARIVLYGTRELKPGERAFARLHFTSPVVAKFKDPLVLRFYSPVVTVGGGRVIDPAPPKQNLKAEARIAHLQAFSSGSKKERFYLAIHSQSRLFQSIKTAAIRAGLNLETELKSILDDLIEEGRLMLLTPQIAVSDRYLEKLKKQAQIVWENFYRDQPLKLGIKREEARSRLLPRQAIDVQDGALQALIKQGLLQEEKHVLRLQTHHIERPEPLLAFEKKLLELYLNQGFEPYDKAELLTLDLFKKDLDGCRKALQLTKLKDEALRDLILDDMVDQELLVLLTPELFLPQKAYEDAKALVISLIKEQGTLKLSDFRDRIQSSRKYAVALLEKLDRDKITRLKGDVRVLI